MNKETVFEILKYAMPNNYTPVALRNIAGQIIKDRPELFNPWRPINAAPKDGTMLIVFCKENGIVTASWEKLFEVHGKPHFEWKITLSNGSDISSSCNPTHWMPLPESPNKSQ